MDQNFVLHLCKLRRTDIGRGKVSNVPCGNNREGYEVNFRMKGFCTTSYEILDRYYSSYTSTTSPSNDISFQTIKNYIEQTDYLNENWLSEIDYYFNEPTTLNYERYDTCQNWNETDKLEDEESGKLIEIYDRMVVILMPR